MKLNNLLASAAVAALALGGGAYAQQNQNQNPTPANQQQQQTGGETANQPQQPSDSQSQQAQGSQQQGDQQPQQAQGSQQQGDQQTQQAQGSQQQGGQSQGAQVYISAAAVRDIERTLNQQGYDVGAVDGELDEEALRNFQEAEGVAPTGKLTVATVRALGMEDMLRSGAQDGQPAASGDAQSTAVMVGPDLVRQVQQALADQGYDVGGVDGQWGDNSKSAAERFAQEQGLKTGGNLTLQLVEALDVDLGAAAQGGQQQAQAGGGQQPEATPLYVSSQVVTEAKRALNERGYDAGSLSPEWNDEATSALQNFQQAEGLPTSENLTVSALSALGVDFRGGAMGSAGAQFTSGEMTDDVEVEVIDD